MLVTLVDNDVDKGYVYKGDLKSWAEMTEFLEAYALPPAEDDSAGGSESETGAEDAKKKKKKKGPAGPPTLTDDDFGAQVLKSQNAWMVLFRDGTPSEEGGDGIVPDDWAKVAAKADGLISAGEVDCKASAKLCDSGVTLPYIVVYGFGLEEKEDIMAIER